MPRLLAVLILAAAAYAYPWTAALIALAAAVSFGTGYRYAVRTNGAQMIRAGSRRLVKGRF